LIKYQNEIFNFSNNGEIQCISNKEIHSLQLPEIDGLFKYLDVEVYGNSLLISSNLGLFRWRLDRNSGNPELIDYEPIKDVAYIDTEENTVLFATKNHVYKKSLEDELVHCPVSKIQSVDVNDISSTQTDIHEFAYNENEITLSWDYISLEAPLANFRYKLHGHNSTFLYTKETDLNYSSLTPGDYSFEIACTSDGYNYETFETVEIRIRSPFWQTTWFYLFSTFLVVTIAILFYRIRINRLRSKVEFEKLLVELRAKALFGQLNPHMIYNVLNSIQGLVAKRKHEQANIYISRFSKFLRRTLKYYKLMSIKINEEIEITEQYIELEKLRFRDQIQFRISDSFDQADFQVPPLILQPLIENAIKHGIRPKNGLIGDIEIELVETEDFFIVQVLDNGIGFPDSMKFGDGLQISSQRIKSLHEKNDLSIERVDNTTLVQLKIKKID
jgi:hypothetical protein